MAVRVVAKRQAPVPAESWLSLQLRQYDVIRHARAMGGQRAALVPASGRDEEESDHRAEDLPTGFDDGVEDRGHVVALEGACNGLIRIGGVNEVVCEPNARRPLADLVDGEPYHGAVVRAVQIDVCCMAIQHTVHWLARWVVLV